MTISHAGPLPVGMRLSPHLGVTEFLRSSRHPYLLGENVLVWTASPQIRANALRLAVDVFEPARALVGRLRVASGFRSPALNRAVGGSGSLPGQRPSAHMDGRAIDVVPMDLTLREAMDLLLASSVPYEKVIYEKGQWIHLQAPRHSEAPRRVALMWFGGADYPLYDANDSRIARAA